MGFFDRSSNKQKARKAPGPAGASRMISKPSAAPQPGPSSGGAAVPPSQFSQQACSTHQCWLDPRHGILQPQAQVAGYLPAPAGWTPPQQQQPQMQLQPVPQQPYAYRPPFQPVVVNHHYYLGAPPTNPERRPATSGNGNSGNSNGNGSGALGSLGKLGLNSVVNLTKDLVPTNINVNTIPQLYDDGLSAWHGVSTQLLNQTAALYDQIAGRFNDVMTLIDRENYAGHEKDLFYWQPTAPVALAGTPGPLVPGGAVNGGASGGDVVAAERGLGPALKPKKRSRDAPKGQTTAVAAHVVSGGYFAKVELYSNSRLPMNLPPLKLYMPTWPLLCLAATYAERVYDSPRGTERNAHVDADWRTGTKAMVIKSVPMDDRHTIVFAIRGTATFMDWAVNLNAAPISPSGFLDDPGNLCHAGFLAVARRMVKPVAARLRQLLEEDPGRSSYSLLITGHSAGGAVASLLYCHMLAATKAAESELNVLTGCFKRIHCVTFGTPPVSLIPLTKPDKPELRKSLFLSFINEGDPVARADKAYVKSLMDLFMSPVPEKTRKSEDRDGKSKGSSKTSSSNLNNKPSKSSVKTSKSGESKKSTSSSSTHRPIWKVPPCTLSNAGRLVVLRSGDPKARVKGKKTVEERLNEGVIAQTIHHEHLKDVVWGDPVCHVMKLYSGRIETLAVGAVTAKHYD